MNKPLITLIISLSFGLILTGCDNGEAERLAKLKAEAARVKAVETKLQEKQDRLKQLETDIIITVQKLSHMEDNLKSSFELKAETDEERVALRQKIRAVLAEFTQIAATLPELRNRVAATNASTKTLAEIEALEAKLTKLRTLVEVVGTDNVEIYKYGDWFIRLVDWSDRTVWYTIRSGEDGQSLEFTFADFGDDINLMYANRKGLVSPTFTAYPSVGNGVHKKIVDCAFGIVIKVRGYGGISASYRLFDNFQPEVAAKYRGACGLSIE